MVIEAGNQVERRRFPTLEACLALILIVGAFGAGILWGSRKGVPFFEEVETWSIGVYEGETLSGLQPSTQVENPVLSAQDVTDVDASFVADPFAIRIDGRHFLFFEVMNKGTGQGDIAVAESPDGLNWSYRQVVLDEPFHLSFPHVFEWEGEYFMVPESEKDLSVRLYKATNFPTGWEFQGKILDGGHYVDPVPFRHDGRWWLFVSPLTNDILDLYYSDDLLGPWTTHPRSPLIAGDPNIARAGGRVFAHDGRLFRFTQDDSPSYGNRLRVFEILELTTETYAEEPLTADALLGPSGSGWNRDGMHHLEPFQTGSGWIAYVDGRSTIMTLGWRF